MPKNTIDEATVAAIDPRAALRSALDAQVIGLRARNKELAAIRKQLDRETEANDEAIRIALEADAQAHASLQRSAELALTESV